MLKVKEDLDCRATAAGEKKCLFTHMDVKLVRNGKKRTKRREGEVTSVPWRRVACVANVFIFSLYSWAALLLYLALAALVVHPCWLKNAICHQKRRTKVHTKNSVAPSISPISLSVYSPHCCCLPLACTLVETMTNWNPARWTWIWAKDTNECVIQLKCLYALHLHLPDKGQMDPKRSVCPRAIYT